MSRKYSQKEVAALRMRQAEIIRQFKDKGKKQREFGRGMSTLGEPFTVEKKPPSLTQSDLIRMQRDAGPR